MPGGRRQHGALQWKTVTQFGCCRWIIHRYIRIWKRKKPVLYGQPPFLIRTAHTHTCILGAYCVYCPAINSWSLFCKFNLENLIGTWWSRRRFPSHFTVKMPNFGLKTMVDLLGISVYDSDWRVGKKKYNTPQ